jgi:hypothetical protein
LASGPARTWHWWLVRNLTTYTGAGACSEAQARERVASARGCATSTVNKHRAARRCGWGGRRRREATCACTRTGARSQERPGARTTRWKDITEGGVLARRGGTPASSAQSRNRENKGRAFSLPTQTRARVHRRVGMTRVRVCVRRGHNHGDGRDNGGDAMTRKNKQWNEEERPASGAASTAKMTVAPARSDFPAWLDGRHHTARARQRSGVPGHDGELTRLDV